MKWKPYPTYKDSGVEWLGEVPEHWSIMPLSRVTAEKCDGPFGSGLKSDHYTESGVRVIRLQNIRSGSFDDTDKAYIESSYFNTELQRHNVQAGDLLIAGLGDDNHTVGRCCVAPEGITPAMVKADCFRFRLDTRRSFPVFMALQLSVSAPCDAGKLATGSTRSRIPLSTMSARVLALPPGAEQSMIAEFLECETAKIDTLIAKQERLIELLQEKRQALISRAVTNGLNPDAPMKPSGVEGLGEIPRHWAITRLAFCCSGIRTGPFGSDLHAEDYVENGRPVINPANIVSGKFVPDPKCTVDEETAYRLSSHWLTGGDVVVGRRGEMGRCAAVGPNERGWICGTGCLRVSPHPSVALPDFLQLVVQSQRTKEWLSLESVGSTMENLNASILGRVPLQLPPVAEQALILRHIGKQSTSLDDLIGKANAAIALMRERRIALISAAVTGKIDVREPAYA